MDERETSCLYWKRILALDLNGKDLNHWPKVVVISCKIWLLKADRVSLFKVAVIETISREELR